MQAERVGVGVARPASGLDESVAEHARIGTLDLAWVDSGPGTGGAAGATSPPPLLLVHGFTGHRDDFIGVIPRLAQERRVIAVDLRGHGDSGAEPGPLGWSLEQLMRDVVALLEHLEVPRCDLLGHSVGGMVALRLALAHPDRLRSLTLMSTAPEVPATLSRESFEKAAELAEAQGMARLQALIEKVGRIDPSPAVRSWGERYWLHHRRRLCAMTPESYRGIGLAFFDSESLVARLPELDLPTLVLVGEADHDWLPGAELFERHCSRAQRVTLAAAEHHPHQENPAAWFEAVESHLASLADSQTPRTSDAPRAHERNEA